MSTTRGVNSFPPSEAAAKPSITMSEKKHEDHEKREEAHHGHHEHHHHPEPHHKFHYFVDNKKYESDERHVTGKFIMERIPNYNPTYTLFLEGTGNDPDQKVGPETSITLG